MENINDNQDHNQNDENVNDDPSDDNDHEAPDPLLEEAKRLRYSEDPTIESDPIDNPGAWDSAGEFDPPPPYTPPPGSMTLEDRLVRDPQASLGGVLSGLAHRYGWDVSLTRLAFVVILLLSGGSAFVAYLLAWVVIPRAQLWPPTVQRPARSLSSRDLGIAAIGLALLVVVGVSSGGAAGIIVPLALVGGGIWLLTQNPREALAPTGVSGTAAAGQTNYSSLDGGSPIADSGSWTTPQAPYVSPQPVAPRSRGRRVAIVGLIGLVLLIPIAVGGAIVAVTIFGEGDFGESVTSVPTEIALIPTDVNQDIGEYILDLTGVDFSSIEPGDDPVEVSIDLDVGAIEVIVASDVRTEVDASVNGVGEVTVFNRNSDGIEPSLEAPSEDPQLILDLVVDVGAIEVVRG